MFSLSYGTDGWVGFWKSVNVDFEFVNNM